MTSGMRRLLSSLASAWRRSASKRARAIAGAPGKRLERSSRPGSSGKVSIRPSARSKCGFGLPQVAARRLRADRNAFPAWFNSSRTLDSATRALVSSTGETLPAATRREAASAPRRASWADSSARRSRSWAARTSKNAVMTVARTSARLASNSADAASLPRSAACTRALRLPPSSIGWLSR